MSDSALSLLLYAGWFLLLLSGIAVLRSTLVLSGQRAANAFTPSGDDVSEFSARLCRAHANCYENLPAFAAIVLVAIATGNAHVSHPLALWAVLARVAQSTTHLVSISSLAVQVRFALLMIQVLIQVWWVVGLLRAG